MLGARLWRAGLRPMCHSMHMVNSTKATRRSHGPCACVAVREATKDESNGMYK
jgi:hypothetical protein